MKHIKLFLPAAATFFLPLFLSAQDVHFSQMTETPLLLNPAEAGLAHPYEGIINFKDQWRSVTSTPYRTYNVCGDMAFLVKNNGSHLGAGLNVFSDKAGDGQMGTTAGSLHLSGILAANDRNLLSVGLYGGFGQCSLSDDKLYWDKQYDGMNFDANRPTFEPTAVGNFSFSDFGAGVAWNYGKIHSTMSAGDDKTFNAGFSVQHINQPAYSFYGENGNHLPMKFVAHGNADIGLKNKNLILEPSYIVFLQGGHHEINAGMLVKMVMQDASHYTGRKKPGAFIIGGYYRLGDAVVVATGYEFSGFRIGLSYDVNLSDLKTASKARGGFEVALRYSSPNPFGKGGSSKSFD
jgi:type IX secretion system PorP/SprF family membrane protein